jgi:hypothetical protein
MRRSQEPTETESLAAADEVATAVQVGTAYWGQGKARGGIRTARSRSRTSLHAAAPERRAPQAGRMACRDGGGVVLGRHRWDKAPEAASRLRAARSASLRQPYAKRPTDEVSGSGNT